MKKLNIILTVLLMMSIMTGCGTKPVTTAVEVSERYLTSDRYENYHMDGFMTVTTTFLSDDELSFEAPVTVSVSEDVRENAGNRQVYVCEDGKWRKSESSAFDYAVLTDITSDMFEDSELTVIDTEDDVIYSVMVPMSKMMHNESIADIFEELGLERAGAPGTTAALAMLNDQVKKGGVMASSYVGGLSGAFIPVSEDQGMIDAVEAGALTLEKLEAMTCVCSVGLDMIAIPGDTKATTISGIIADEMAIGMVNQKTTAVRLIPVIGKGVGETVEFGGLLGYAPIMPVNQFDNSAFINRGGRIPAPIHSFKN